MMEFAITTAVLVAICGILATKDQSPNSSPQSVASRNALERGRFFFAQLRRPGGQRGQFQKGQTSKRFASTSLKARPCLSVLGGINKQEQKGLSEDSPFTLTRRLLVFG